MAVSTRVRYHASRLSVFLGLQRSTVGVPATAVLVYIPVAWMADRSTKKPFVVATFFFFSRFPLLLRFSYSLGWLAVAFILRGLTDHQHDIPAGPITMKGTHGWIPRPMVGFSSPVVAIW